MKFLACQIFALSASTNGDNEVWNLAKDQAHYDAIAAVMRLRENLRSYVAKINAETAATGMPMVRAMFLQFPNDSVCQTAAVEDQFMFGPDWLVVSLPGWWSLTFATISVPAAYHIC